MSLVLHYSPDSANVIVRTALEELRLPYTDVLVDRAGKVQQSPEFRAMNPQGLLPVLVVPGQDEPLFETAAILLYLADHHDGLLPAGAGARGRALKWLFYLSNTLHADLRVMFYSPRYVADAQAVPTLRQALRERVLGHLSLLDAEIGRRGGQWLLGDACSICDIYLAWCARWAQLYPLQEALPGERLQALAHLWRMLATLEQRTSVLRACAREEIDPLPFTAPRVPQPSRGSVTG